jgi:hypothetical protein
LSLSNIEILGEKISRFFFIIFLDLNIGPIKENSEEKIILLKDILNIFPIKKNK